MKNPDFVEMRSPLEEARAQLHQAQKMPATYEVEKGLALQMAQVCIILAMAEELDKVNRNLEKMTNHLVHLRRITP